MVLARWQATIVDDDGNVQDGATVTVRREVAGSPLASLFSDRAGVTPTGNPVTADVDGFASFHAPGGAYQITAAKAGFTRTWRYVAIGLAAESDFLTTGATWTFSTTITDADPGAGALRFNNASPASVGQIFFDNLSRSGADLTAWLDSLDNYALSADRGVLVIQTADQLGLMIARVTGSVIDGTGYRKVSVTPISTSGSFLDGAVVSVSFSPSPLNGINPGIVFTFSTTTAMADPGSGQLRLNNATLSSVTAAAVDDLSSAGGNPDVSAAVLSWDDSANTANRGMLLLKDVSAPQNFALYKITGASTDNAGWTQLALTYVAHAGSFAGGATLSAEFAPAGDGLSAATETVAGVVEQATDAEIRASTTGNKAVMAEDLKTAAASVALTDAATIALDWTAGINFGVTITANRILGNPTNGIPGTWRTVYVLGNDGTDRTLTFGNQYLGEVPPLTDIDNTRNYLLMIYCQSTTHFVVSAKRASG